MSEKMFNTRIIHKHDTAENWEKATGFIPKSGELIVYDPDENFGYARTKIGDGATPVTELPFTEVQSDWNQNNETAANFIKNKPSLVGKKNPEAEGAEIFNNYATNKATGAYSHAEGHYTTASGAYSHAEGSNTKATDAACHAEGASTTASGVYSHAEGASTIAEGDYSHAEGTNTKTMDTGAHAEGTGTIAKGVYSHAEGRDTRAIGSGAHAEGYNNTYSIKVTGAANSRTYTLSENVEANKYIRLGAIIIYNNVFGTVSDYNPDTRTVTVIPSLSREDLNEQTVTLCFGAFGFAAHSEGQNTLASSSYSHAEGRFTTAFNEAAHAEGYETIASGAHQHVQGKYNIADSSSLAHIVGNGTEDARSNAHTIDWEGNAWFQGDVYVGSTSGTNKDEGSKKLATEEYVDNARPAETTSEDIIEWMGQESAIIPLASSNGQVYATNDNKILII